MSVRIGVLGVILLFVFEGVCFADILYLKNGNELEGKIIEETETKVTLEIFGGRIEIHRSEIESIERKKYNYRPARAKEEAEPEKEDKPETLRWRDTSGARVGATAELLESRQFLIYLPSGIKPKRKYPLIVALSPAADAASMINTWRAAAEKNQWIIFASKEYKNGLDLNKIIPHLAALLERTLPQLPVERSQIIAAGFSGGGTGAHAFAFLYPDLISAVVTNTGKILDYYIAQKDNYPKRKIAVFLASPTDFRYQEMKRDRDFLEGLGWRTQWIEFKGGHNMAPDSVYQKTAQWLKRQF